MCPKAHNNLNPSRDNHNSGKLARIAQLETEIAKIREMEKVQTVLASDLNFNTTVCHNDLRNLVDSNMMPMHRSDIYGNIYEINDAMIHFLGYSREEFLSGRVRWTSITPPEYLHLDERAIGQIKATGVAQPWEKQYICKDGTRKTCLIGVVAADRTGKDCFAVCVDITERKRIESELRASEAKFRMLAEAIPNIVWLAEPDGRVLYHNQRFFEYTGFTREDEHELLWMESVHASDLTPFRKRFVDAASRREPFESECRYRNKSGDYRWHLTRGFPLVSPETGKLVYFGTCTDIDEGKQLQEELRESEVRFNTLANAIPQIVWTAQPGGKIEFFNDRWFEYTGLTDEQSKDDGWQLLIHPDDLPRYMSGWQNALATGDSFEIDFRLKRAVFKGNRGGQTYRWHLCRAVAVRDSDGQIVKWFATWTEIEDQKAAQGK
jgi:PAS domain S-box-containing protein